MRLLSERVVVILFCSGVAILLWAVTRGNQEIFVLPLVFWCGVILWPRGTGAAIPRRQVAARPNSLVFGLLFAASCVIWAYVLTACIPWNGQAKNEAIEHQLDSAEQQYREGHLKKALESLIAIQIPDTLPIQRARKCHNCGVILIQLGRYDEAAKYLDPALRYDASDAQAAHLLAVLSWQNGESEQALALADRALSIDPGYRPALRFKAEILRLRARE